ncbi:MAG: hypothetical protein VKP62_09485 [Candidatus Sericytochromatia bacterium]|nr:hypothetical protein [Candidatus Sericytochromatia bacterium]
MDPVAPVGSVTAPLMNLPPSPVGTRPLDPAVLERLPPPPPRPRPSAGPALRRTRQGMVAVDGNSIWDGLNAAVAGADETTDWRRGTDSLSETDPTESAARAERARAAWRRKNRIETLRQLIAKLKVKMATLGLRLQKLGKQLGVLQGKLAVMRGKLSAAINAKASPELIASLKARIKGLEDQVVRMTQDISTGEYQMAQFTEAMGAATTELDALLAAG